MIDMGITGEMEGEFDVHRTTLEEYACFHFGLPAQKYDDLPLEEEKSAIASIADASKLVEKLKLRNLLEQRTISQSIGSSDKTFYNPILAAPYVATPSNEIPATEETAHARALEILTIVEYEVAELEAAMHIIEKTRLNWQEDIEYYRSITQESHELGKTLERRVTNIGSKRDSMILTMEDIISRGLVLIDDIRAQIKKMLEKRPKKETYRAEGEEIFIEPVSLPPTKEQTLKVIGAYLKDLEFDVSFSP